MIQFIKKNINILPLTVAAFFLSFANIAQAVEETNNATCASNLGTLGDLFRFATCLLGKTIPLLITLALVAFMYGVIQYLINGEDENKRKEGRKFMLWGIISLFVMLGVFGILQVLGNTLDIGTGGSISDITPHF